MDGTDNRRIGRTQVAVMAATLAAGLAADVYADALLQLLIGAGFWAVLFHVCGRVGHGERRELVACLAIATGAELFLSLGWGLYVYRLGNVPMFVPPGHVLLFLLGRSLAGRLSEPVAASIAALAAVCGLAAAAAGVDTLALPLLLMFVLAWLARPAERRLLAATFVLALALELYGTALGTWTWLREVPGTPLVTTNPPGLGGALYSTLDALVAFACTRGFSPLSLPSPRPPA
jgi:hypothetical protein